MRVIFKMIGILAVLAVSACKAPQAAETPDESLADQPISYACDDVIVVGRVAHQQFTPISDGYILGHGRIDFDLNVQRVVYGRESRETVPARVVAHTYARENVDFMFVLKPGADDRYDEITGSVITQGQAQPQLAPHCTTPDP